MARRRKGRSARNVVDLDVKRSEKLTEDVIALVQESARLLDEMVERIVAAYHQWELENPELAVRRRHKMEMVRLGFVGSAGFDRCHESHRLPADAFFTEDGVPSDEIMNDYDASDVLMCPAMEARTCQGVWRAMRMPPCYLLLLEIHRGLGGGCRDDGVQEAVDDFGRWQGPEQYAESFVRAERLLRRHRP